MQKMTPFISVRDVVLFPDNPKPLQIGRPFSIASIKRSLSEFDGKLVIATQRYVELDEKPDLEQIFPIGCVCQIEEHIDFPDGAMRILVSPQERIRVSKLQDEDGVRFCSGKILSKFSKGDNISKEEKTSILSRLAENLNEPKSDRLNRILASLREESNSYNFVMRIGHLLCRPKIAQREPTIEQINEGIFIIDTYSKEEKANINLGLARIQEILEVSDSSLAIKKIKSLLS